MPTPGWLTINDLPVDARGRILIDPASLDQMLDQDHNWRGDVNMAGHNLINVGTVYYNTLGVDGGASGSSLFDVKAGGAQSGPLTTWRTAAGATVASVSATGVITAAGFVGPIGSTDPSLILNNDYTGSAPSENGGLQVERGTLPNASLLWDEATDQWKAGLLGSEVAISLAGHKHVVADITDFPAVVTTSRKILTGTGLTGGGDLSADRTISIVPGSVNQLVEILHTGAHQGTQPAINFIDGANVVLSFTEDTTLKRVNVTINSTGGGSGGGAQTPWLSDIDAQNFKLFNVGRIGIGVPTTAAMRSSLEVSTDTVTDTYRGIVDAQYYTGPHSAVLWQIKGRGTRAAPASVAAGDFLGHIIHLGVTTDGSIAGGTSMFSYVTAVGTGTIAADLAFATNSGTANAAERMRITAAGNLCVNTTTADLAGITVEGNVAIRNGNYLMLRPAGNTWDMRLQATGNQLDVLSGGNLSAPIASFLNGGYVGINNPTPGQALDVFGNTRTAGNAVTGPVISIWNKHATSRNCSLNFTYGSGNTFGWSLGSDYNGNGGSELNVIRADGGRVMTFLQSGNVGIGTTAPNAMLDFGANAIVDVLHIFDNGSNKYGFGIQPAEFRMYADNGGSITFGHITYANVFTERMRIASGGFVGIGTASPVALLDVKAAANYHFVACWNQPNSVTIGGVTDGFTAWQPLSINPGSNVYLCAGSGNVGIGTATPAGKFHVEGGRSSFRAASEPYALALAFNSAQVGSDTWFIGVGDNGGNANTGRLFFSNAGGSGLVSINFQGDLALNGVWNSGRLKLGAYYLWVTSAGRLMIKANAAPINETDGVVVGSQS